jgi:phenylacetate-coenzyme A ligase PaaK-like adenylate-forming protein
MLNVYKQALEWQLFTSDEVKRLAALSSGDSTSQWIGKLDYRCNSHYQSRIAQKKLFESRGVTTGSSGEPFTVIQSPMSRLIKGWTFNRFLTEIRKGSPLILLWRNKTPSIKQRLEISAGRLDLIPIYDLADVNLSTFDELKAEIFYRRVSLHKKAVVRSYVSVLVWLCHTLGTRLKALNLRCVIASAESLSAVDWDLIERCFGCPCINLYGGTEASPIAASTLISRNLYVFDHLYKVNVSNEEENKRIIVTDKINSAMPIVSYDIGDITTGMDSDQHGVFLKDVIGRVSEMIENINGQILSSHFIHIIFRDLMEVKRYRVYWLSPGQIKLQIELIGGSLSDSRLQQIINSFSLNGFHVLDTKFTKIEQLKGMKHRTVVKL